MFINRFTQLLCVCSAITALSISAQTRPISGHKLPQPPPTQHSASAQMQAINSASLSKSNNTARKDPTRPKAFVADNSGLKTPEQTAFLLSAIFKRNNEYYAIINAQVVKTNEIVGNKRVLLITESNLILEDTNSPEEAMVLELFGSNNIKTQVQK